MGRLILTKRWLKRAAAKLVRASGWDEAAVWKKIYATLFPPTRNFTAAGRCRLRPMPVTANSVEIFQDENYISGLRSLLRTALIASMRDPVSAARAANISGEPSTNHAGVDAALSSNRSASADVTNCGYPQYCRRECGIFFGRTPQTNMMKLAFALAFRRHARGSEPVWLRWLPPQSMPWSVAKMFGIKETLAPHSLDEFIQAIRSCRFVITDMYHLSLVSWSYGVPAICIGRGAQHFRRLIDDKKKELFFLSNFLEDFLYFYRTRDWQPDEPAGDPGHRARPQS